MSTKLFPLWIAFNITLLTLGLIFFLYFLLQLRQKILLKEKMIFLKPSSPQGAFALALAFTEEAFFHALKISILSHKDKDLYYTFPVKDESFCLEIPFQEEEIKFIDFLKKNPTEIILFQFESTGPHFFKFEYNAKKLLQNMMKAKITCEEYEEKYLLSDTPSYNRPIQKFINEVPVEKRSYLVLESHPKLKNLFQNQQNTITQNTPQIENFKVQKVWIEPGCIVCNACENIIPEVFDVKPPTCVIKDNAPLENGIKIEEAAEACPVNVIKFIK